MEATEATATLKPRKHMWYGACFLVLLSTVAIDFLKHIIMQPALHATVQHRLNFVGEMVGGMMGDMIVMAPGLIFVLTMLFFFDGWFSKTIVGIVLAGWTLIVAVDFAYIPSPRPHSRRCSQPQTAKYWL